MQLTFDVFSGQDNPSWRFPLIFGRTIFDMIADNGLLRSPSSNAFSSRLGYRGLQLMLPSEIYLKYHVPPVLNLSADVFDHLPLFQELASVAKITSWLGFPEFWRVAQAILNALLLGAPPPPPPPKKPAAASGPCAFETLAFDPAPWNDPAFKPTNNCYAYAANKRAAYPSKPQPGIGSGAEYASVTGPEVKAAAKRDGAHDVNDCFPDGEAPRMLVALVIWPGQDYHWYRKHPDCWGHKPGGTDARNIDSSGKVITDPETCDRGPYTEFHGYMLIPKSQKVAA